MPDTDLNIRIRGNSSEADRAFGNAERAARTLARELARLESQQRQMAQQEAAAYREQAARASAQERQVRELARLQAQAQREDAQRTERAAADAEAAAAAQADAMQEVGAAAAAMGAAIALALGVSVKAAIDWQTAWAGVAKTVDGTATQMETLEGDLRGLATTLPTTHEEIAAVAEAAGQLGVKRSDIASFTKTMIDLGNATNLSADEAATGLAQLGTVMGVLPDQASRAGAALVALGNDGASTEADILAMSLRISGAGRVIGLTEDQVMGFASALSSVGIEAQAGGSSISRVMVDISGAVKGGGKSLETFAKVAGMTASEFTTLFEQDAAHAVTAFIGGLGKMQASGEDTFGVLDELGLSEIQVRDTLLRTALAGDLLNKSLDTSATAWREQTALVDEAGKRYETAESRIKIARNQLNDTAIDIGAVLLPALVVAVDKVGALAGAFRVMPDGMKTTVTILGAVAAAALTVGGAALLVIPQIAALRAALATMGATGAVAGRALSVLGKVGGAATIAAVGVIALMAGMRKLQDQIVPTIPRVAELTDMLLKLPDDKPLASLGEGFADLGEKVDRIANKSTQQQLDDTLNSILSFGQLTSTSLREAQDTMGGLDDALTGLVESGHADLAADQFARLQAEAVKQGAAIGSLTTALPGYAEALQNVGTEQQVAAASALNLAKNYSDTSATASDASDAVDALKSSLDEFNGIALSSRDAARGWEKSIRDAQQALKDNGATLDITTQKGSDNAAALDDIADSALDMAKAQVDAKVPLETITATLEKQRARLFTTARQFGMSEQQARAYVDTVLTIPENITTSYATRGDGTVISTAQGLKEVIGNVPGSKAITFTSNAGAVTGAVEALAEQARRADGFYSLNFNATLFKRAALAEGAVIDYYAAGGENHVAQIAPAGSWRVWAEPETGGEAYIPLAANKRSRSLDIWAETGRRLGVHDFADGGVTSSVVTGPTNVRVFIGQRELTDLVRVEVDGANDAQARALSYGRRP